MTHVKRSVHKDKNLKFHIENKIRKYFIYHSNRILSRVYIRSITRSTMYQKLNFGSHNWRIEN